ncbi:hypothetical protein D3C87_1422890 [compost metagenome]
MVVQGARACIAWSSAAVYWDHLSARPSTKEISLPRPFRLAVALALPVALATACAPWHRIMDRSRDASFPGARGDAARYEAQRAEWTRTEALGVRSEATVTMLDPSLGAHWLAAQAGKEGREVSDAYDRDLWEGLYGPRGDRLPFQVSWRFDKLYQPQRVTNPKVGWTFTLQDDHGRSWGPLFLGDVQQGFDVDAWTGSFRVWFPTKDTLKGPLFDGRTRSITLRISGAPGAADFVWKFQPEIGAPAED